jgi:hypothetical protein
MSVWDLIDECAEAGVVFKPKGDKLNPELTRGSPGKDLLEKVKFRRLEIRDALRQLTDFPDDLDQPPLQAKTERKPDATEIWKTQQEKRIAFDSTKRTRAESRSA